MAHQHGKHYRGSVQVPGMPPLRKGGFTTKAAAKKWERDTRSELERGTYRDPSAGDVTFALWVKEWQATRGVHEQRTNDEADSIVRVHLLPVFGPRRLDEISPLLVRQFVSTLSGRRAPKTVRNVHGVLHSIFKLAVDTNVLTANPCAGTVLPAPERRKQMACLTEQQIAQLAAAVPDHWRPLILTLAGTGLRWGEAVGLKVKYVDLLARPPELRVQETLNPTATAFKAVPKTASSRRTIGLPPPVAEILPALVAGKAGEEPVFTMPDGSLIKHRWFNYSVWQPACKQVGITATPHDLRHSHVALLIAANVPLSAISRRLGHKSIQITHDTYGYLLPRVESDLLAALDAALSPAAPVEPQPAPAPEPTQP